MNRRSPLVLTLNPALDLGNHVDGVRQQPFQYLSGFRIRLRDQREQEKVRRQHVLPEPRELAYCQLERPFRRPALRADPTEPPSGARS